MTVVEQFTEIITKHQGDDFMPFLKGLTPDHKKLLIAPIKKLAKEYSQFGDLGGGRYGNINGTDKQRHMLQIASFVCFNLVDYEKSHYSVWMLDETNLRGLIDWYIPGWFSDFVNKQAARDSLPYYLHYDWIMKLADKGLVRPSRELLVRAMPIMIFDHHDKKSHYKPENLLARTVTLSEHIWYLFELESNLHYSDRFLYFGDDVPKESIGWKTAFTTYAKEGKIDRQRLLKESLLASNRNFNKVLSGWFVQLFTDLQPETKELLTLQKELCSVLNSPHSKVVGTCLQMIKKILGEKEYHVDEFLDAVPILLASDTKVTVASVLMLLEKIAKEHKDHRERICMAVCQVFVHPHAELQEKTAHLIISNRDSLRENFHQELEPFYASMLASAKKILGDFISPARTEPGLPAPEVHEVSEPELSEIPPVKNLDDLVFLASQAFDNNQAWHIDQLASELVRFYPHVKPEDIPRFAPGFQRALNLVQNGLLSTTGYLDQLHAMFFIDFGNHLMQNFPAAAETITKVYTKYDQVDGENRNSWTVSPKNSSYTEEWEPYNKIHAYSPYKYLMILALAKIKNGDDMPVLSAPSHAPGWIMPEILIDRLHTYQQNNKKPDPLDLQIAISRCYMKTSAATSKYAHEKLSGEHLHLMQFLLDENVQPHGPFVYEGAWMVASLCRKEKKKYPAFKSFPFYKKSFENYTGQHKWESVDEEYTFSSYDFRAKKEVPVTKRHKILRVFKGNSGKKESESKKKFPTLSPSGKDAHAFLYDYLTIETQFLEHEHNDIKRLMLLAPNNPEPMLADIANQSLNYPAFFSESDKRLVNGTLQLLHEIWADYGEMAHVFIGTSMISSDKTAANIAGEIWIKAVTFDKIDNAKLGEVIGTHERIEFVPLKRFTDLVTRQLLRISAKHNRALQVVIENLLKQLPAKPITNLKKLLELYAELMAINNVSLTDQTILNKIQSWKGSAGIQKIAHTLLPKG